MPTVEELSALIEEIRTVAVPVGSVVAYVGEITDDEGIVEVRPGWLLCNGAAVRDSEFPALFAVIQASHGNGQESDFPLPGASFNLPDYRGLFLRGVNGARTGPLSDPDTSGIPEEIANERRPHNHLGGNVGNRVGSVQVDTLQDHTHGVSDPGHAHIGSVNAAREEGPNRFDAGDGRGVNNGDRSLTINSNTTDVTVTGPNSGSHGDETRPRNAYVHWIIRAR